MNNIDRKITVILFLVYLPITIVLAVLLLVFGARYFGGQSSGFIVFTVIVGIGGAYGLALLTAYGLARLVEKNDPAGIRPERRIWRGFVLFIILASLAVILIVFPSYLPCGFTQLIGMKTASSDCVMRRVYEGEKDPAICDRVAQQRRDHCLGQVAYNAMSPTICESISRVAYESQACFRQTYKPGVAEYGQHPEWCERMGDSERKRCLQDHYRGRIEECAGLFASKDRAKCYADEYNMTGSEFWCELIENADLRRSCLKGESLDHWQVSDGINPVAVPTAGLPRIELRTDVDCEGYARPADVISCYGYLARLTGDKSYCGRIRYPENLSICYQEFYASDSRIDCAAEPGAAARDNCRYGQAVEASDSEACTVIDDALLREKCSTVVGQQQKSREYDCTPGVGPNQAIACTTGKAAESENLAECQAIRETAPRSACYAAVARAADRPGYCAADGIDTAYCVDMLMGGYGYGSGDRICALIEDEADRTICLNRNPRSPSGQ